MNLAMDEETAVFSFLIHKCLAFLGRKIKGWHTGRINFAKPFRELMKPVLCVCVT